MSLSIEIKGIKELTAKLGVDIKPAIRTASKAIGEELRDKLAYYPGPSHSPVKWSSLKQKRFYFAMRRKAGLPLRYTRNSDPMSQRLGPSWTVAQKGEGATVGTKATYAPWVQSKEKQWPQHAATGWTTDEAAITKLKQSGAIEKIMLQALSHRLGLS